jgi:hypothetical protein
MLIPNHPDDERLSALASGDPEAVADAALTEHVATCIRCTDTIAELGALRASLAELPDLQPHRPLQLLPPVADTPARADRVGGWARRFFAPMLTAGAALALVGLVGTASPLLGGMASGAADVGMELRGGGAPAAASQDSTLDGTSAGGEENAAEAPDEIQPLQSEDAAAPDADNGDDAQRLSLTDGRPVWPMLLFAGVALMIAAPLLRWILAPRAG